MLGCIVRLMRKRPSQNRRVEHPPWRGLSPFCGVRGARRGLSPSPRLPQTWRCGGCDCGVSDEPGSTESDVLYERTIEQEFFIPS